MQHSISVICPDIQVGISLKRLIINIPQLRQIVVSCSAEDVEVQPTPWQLLEKIKAMEVFFDANWIFWESLKADVVTCAFYRNMNF